MNVESDELEESNGLGIVLVQNAKNPLETEDNRTRIKRMISVCITPFLFYFRNLILA
jgi:hypothetical protein